MKVKIQVRRDGNMLKAFQAGNPNMVMASVSLTALDADPSIMADFKAMTIKVTNALMAYDPKTVKVKEVAYRLEKPT